MEDANSAADENTENTDSGTLTDISMSSDKSSSINNANSDYNNNMKIFLQCVENISYNDDFDVNKSNDTGTGTDDEDQFSDCDLLSALNNGRPIRRRRAATFSFYPEKKKEIRLLSPVPVKKEEFDDDIAARFLMELKAASSLANNNNNNNNNNEINNKINIINDDININNTSNNNNSENVKFVYRPRSNSLPDFGLKLKSTISDINVGDRRGGFIGIYSPEARRKRLERFFEKKKHRVWKRNIKYDVRKNFADSRVRVKGRFVRKDEEVLLREEAS